MYDLNKQKFAVLTFATVSQLRDTVNGVDINLRRDAIVEVAAVKVEKGVIQGHFHSYVAIDGYNAHDIEFDCGNYGAYGVRAEHLIGAPSLQDVMSRLQDYIGDSTLLVHSASSNAHNPFAIFKGSAKSYGYNFDNPTVEFKSFVTANGKEALVEALADNGIYFDPENDDMSLRDRNDPLSWALILGKLFIALFKDN